MEYVFKLYGKNTLTATMDTHAEPVGIANKAVNINSLNPCIFFLCSPTYLILNNIMKTRVQVVKSAHGFPKYRHEFIVR